MKTKHHPESTAHETFAGMVIACFLILTAWGNAIAMLVFSLVAMAAWFMLPETPDGGESTDHRSLLLLAIAAIGAFFVAFLLTIMHSG